MGLFPRLTATLVFVMTGIVLAQDESGASGSRGAGASPASVRSASQSSHISLLKPMHSAVNLDDEQTRRITVLLNAADEEFRAARREMTPDPDVTRRMNETVTEIQAAKAAGDSQKEKQLIQERTALTQEYVKKRDRLVGKMTETDEVLKRNISETLRPEQRKQFLEFWADRHAALAEYNRKAYDGMIRSATALKAATDRLGDLTPEQKTQIEAAFKVHQETMRGPQRQNLEEQALRALYVRVFDIFTDGQRQRVEQELTPKGAPKAGEPTSAPADAPAKTAPEAKAP